jgi:hypothetical protein
MAKAKLDLEIQDLHNIELLGIGDISSYPTNFSIISPSIQITPPGYTKITLPFTPRTMTVYNSTIVGITCTDAEDDCGLVPLPDGIWKIKYTIAPSNEYFVEKSFIRTYSIERQLGNAFLCVDLNTCDAKIKLNDKYQLDRIQFLIQGAIADAALCNDIEAMNKYRLAESMLKNFLKTK